MTETKPNVAELLVESGATAAEIHDVAPHLSIHALRYMRRKRGESGNVHAQALAAALRKLAKRHRSAAAKYERAAVQLRRPEAPPPTVEDVVRGLGVPPLTLQRANPEHLNVWTLHSILRAGKGKIAGDAHMVAVADALDVLAEDARQRAERCETAAASIAKHYPPTSLVARPEPPKGDSTAHMVWMKDQGKKLEEIGVAHGLSRQAVHQRLNTYERQTGTKLKSLGKG
jgi:hypothetical protein